MIIYIYYYHSNQPLYVIENCRMEIYQIQRRDGTVHQFAVCRLLCFCNTVYPDTNFDMGNHILSGCPHHEYTNPVSRNPRCPLVEMIIYIYFVSNSLFYVIRNRYCGHKTRYSDAFRDATTATPAYSDRFR